MAPVPARRLSICLLGTALLSSCSLSSAFSVHPHASADARRVRASVYSRIVCQQSPDLKDAPTRNAEGTEASGAASQSSGPAVLTLPQHDSDPDGRRRELAHKLKLYTFSREELPKGTPMITDVPPADTAWSLGGNPPEVFLYKAGWLWKVATTALRVAVDFIPAKLRGTTREGLRGTGKFANPLTNVVGGIVDLVLSPLDDLGRDERSIDEKAAAPGGEKGATRPTSLQDYADMFGPLWKPPKSMAPHGITDNAYTWYRLAGPNPNAIQKCRTTDQPGVLTQLKDALAQPQYQSLRSELKSLLEAGELYKVDYTWFHGTTTGVNQGPTQYMPSPLALFRLNRDPEARSRMPLEPVLIQVEANSKEIFQPPADESEGPDYYRWLMAKACVQVADNCHHEGIAHLSRTHLVTETFAGSMNRQLSERHPLHKLLAPHFWGTLIINNLARSALIAEGGTVDILLAPSLQELYPLITQEVKKWKARDFSFEAVMASQGMRDLRDEFPYMFPYRDDGSKIWNAICKWVSSYIEIYYKSAQDLENDAEVKAWVDDLIAYDVKWLEDWGAPGTDNRPLLKKLVSAVIFNASAQHAAVNFPQTPLMCYTPAFPLSMYDPPPSLATEPEAHDYVRLFAPMEVAKTQKNVGLLLGTVRHTRLGQYDMAPFRRYFGTDNSDLTAALSKFRKDLDDARRAVDRRNRDLVAAWTAAGEKKKVAECYSYTLLRPDKVPQGINI
ncbi:lipoxygenase [Tribonema minus]|uniref:Lipoxygenase n=1 Tax=Tribonema minus TaxID=303371 RepID=A0A835YNA1_9STRA|nr:lipoxygenase [Tribonema minus]